jgi:capsular polysaccharide biosynthesis protein
MSSGSRGILGSLFGAARQMPPAALFPPRDAPATEPDGAARPPAPPPAIVIDPPRAEPASAPLPPDIPPPAPPPPPRSAVPVAQAAARMPTLASLLPDLPPPLPLPTPPPAAPAEPRIDSFSECRDLARGAVAVAQPGFWGSQTLRLVMAPAAVRPAPPPLLSGTEYFTNEGFRGWHREPRPLPALEVACSFVADAIVSGPGHVWIGGALVTAPEIMPAYVRADHNIPAAGAALLDVHALPLREIAEPCVLLAGHGLHVYGHFMIELLFRVLLMRRLLRGSGLAVRWLLDADSPAWLLRILHADLGIPPAEIEFFRPAEERVRLRQAILAGLVHDDNGFHPYADLLVEDLLASVSPLPEVAPASRLFVARRGFRNLHSVLRNCRNEAALIALAEARGFITVAPETLPWRQQLALFRHAAIIAGTFGSALHTALVAPAGTRIGVVGTLNAAQSEIAALRRHRLAYLTEGFAFEGQYEVPEATFAAFLHALCDPAAEGVQAA